MDYNVIVWAAFGVIIALIFVLFMPRFRERMNFRKEQIIRNQEQMEYYRTMTSEQFDKTPEHELSHAIMYRIMEKENQLAEQDNLDSYDVFDYLNEEEKKIYTLYQMELSLQGGKGSLQPFLSNDVYEKYQPYIEPTFEALNCFEIVELIQAAKRYIDILENDLEDDDEGKYSSYNFLDFTNEFMALLKSGGTVSRMNRYIKEHKESFIDKEEDLIEEESSTEV